MPSNSATVTFTVLPAGNVAFLEVAWPKACKLTSGLKVLRLQDVVTVWSKDSRMASAPPGRRLYTVHSFFHSLPHSFVDSFHSLDGEKEARIKLRL